jgi:hypothetical protein
MRPVQPPGGGADRWATLVIPLSRALGKKLVTLLAGPTRQTYLPSHNNPRPRQRNRTLVLPRDFELAHTPTEIEAEIRGILPARAAILPPISPVATIAADLGCR